MLVRNGCKKTRPKMPKIISEKSKNWTLSPLFKWSYKIMRLTIQKPNISKPCFWMNPGFKCMVFRSVRTSCSEIIRIGEGVCLMNSPKWKKFKQQQPCCHCLFGNSLFYEKFRFVLSNIMVWCIYQKFYLETVLGGSVFRVTVYDLRWPHKPNPLKPQAKRETKDQKPKPPT